MAILTTVLVLAHASTAALWGGAMAYSLLVVQPRLPAMLGDDPGQVRLEEAHRVLGQGNRWPVSALIAVLWLTGAGLVAVRSADSDPGTGWWVAVAAKAALLAAATVLFWWVSWRGWPRRVFALPNELPALRRRFRRVALTMAALVGAAFLLGVLTDS